MRILALCVAALLAGCQVPEAVQGPLPVAGAALCDAALWHHVYHAYRLLNRSVAGTAAANAYTSIDSACATVTGTVVQVRQEADGDDHIRVALDGPFAGMTNAENDAREGGDLVVEPVCVNPVTQNDAMAACALYDNRVTLPLPGDHVSATGDYVLDNDHGWMELHPVTTIVDPAGSTLSGMGPHGEAKREGGSLLEAGTLAR
ncbi:MAG: hypothetical protein ACYDBQ_00040 [Thermoplasmatota archaeon]